VFIFHHFRTVRAVLRESDFFGGPWRSQGSRLPRHAAYRGQDILFSATKRGVGTFCTMSNEAKQQLCPARGRPMQRARTIVANDVQARRDLYECRTCHVTYTEATD